MQRDPHIGGGLRVKARPAREQTSCEHLWSSSKKDFSNIDDPKRKGLCRRIAEILKRIFVRTAEERIDDQGIET
jgi:hypothetical protein